MTCYWWVGCLPLWRVPPQPPQCGLVTGDLDSCDPLISLQDEAKAEGPWLTPRDCSSIEAALTFLASDSATWYPGYACALLALPPSAIQPSPGDLALVLVGLDSWRFWQHCTSGNSFQHTAECLDSVVMPCSALSAEDYGAFLAHLAAIKDKAEQRKDKDRTAAGNKQGHQKVSCATMTARRACPMPHESFLHPYTSLFPQTPAFIHALVEQALELVAVRKAYVNAEVAERQPRGGFTDVGLHTGGMPRDTAWPLVREALRTVLTHVADLQRAAADALELLLARLHLRLLGERVAGLAPPSATQQALNEAMQMLREAASSVAGLARQGHDVAGAEEDCWRARQALEALAAKRAALQAGIFTLPDFKDLAGGSPCAPGTWRCPRGHMPPVISAQADEEGLAQARKQAATNLGSLPLPAANQPDGRTSFCHLREVLQRSELRQGSDLTAQNALACVERELFDRAARGFGAEASLLEAEVDALVEVVDIYSTGE